MHAVVYLGSGNLVVKDIDRPEPARGEVLVKVGANTICGTDLRIANGSKSKGVYPPVVLGHELAGTIFELGEGVAGYQVGDKVGMTPSVACNACHQCQEGNFNLCAAAQVLGHDIDGGLAEYFLVPAAAVASGNLIQAPQHLEPEEIALAEPLSCVLHGQTLMGLRTNDVVLVIGGGAIGQLHAQLAKVAGARTVIVSEPVESRRKTALTLGADIVVDPLTEDLATIVSASTGGRGADAVIVCIGVPQLVNSALELARQRGKVSLFAGFPKEPAAQIDANLIHYKEISVTGSSNSTISEYKTALALISDGRVNVKALVTHRYGLDEIETALKTAASPEALKVAVEPARGQ
jgi:L-iditol 2-dehydrogenase